MVKIENRTSKLAGKTKKLLKPNKFKASDDKQIKNQQNKKKLAKHVVKNDLDKKLLKKPENLNENSPVDNKCKNLPPTLKPKTAKSQVGQNTSEGNKCKAKISTIPSKEKKEKKSQRRVLQSENNQDSDQVEVNDVESTKVETLSEEQFDAILCLSNINKICNSFNELLQKEINKKKNIVFGDHRYMLNISSFNIPNCPKRMVKLNLKHSLVDIGKDDVVLIVPDLQRGAKVDYETTTHHYEDLLHKVGVNRLNIRPFNQLRNECTTFESIRKFANSFDYFLCDGRIVGHVNGFCGKAFQKPRTTLHAVRLNKPENYKREIEHSLKRTAYRQLQKGDLISIPVGSSRLSVDNLAENIKYIIEQLKKVHPGGFENIRNIYLRADIKGTSALPLFINLGEPPHEVPHVIGTRERRLIQMKSKANTILSKFNLSKTAGFVKVGKKEMIRKSKVKKLREVLVINKSSNEKTK